MKRAAQVEYQKGVFEKTPIQAAQTGDTLRVETGPVEGRLSRNAEIALRFPANWPPESV